MREKNRLQVAESTSGQVLIEAIVAMGVLVVAVFAILQFLSRSTSLNRQVSQEYTATYLAAEGLEIVKHIIDSSRMTCGAWNENAVNTTNGQVDYLSTSVGTATGKPIKHDPITGFYQYATGDDTPFKRVISIENISNLDKEMRVLSTVTWKSRGNSQNSVELEDHFFLWKPLPITCF